MKNILCGITIAVILVMIMSQSYASDWFEVNYDGDRFTIAAVNSLNDSDLLVVRFDTQNNCKQNIVLLVKNVNINKRDYDLEAKENLSYRVDKNKIFKNKPWMYGTKGEDSFMLTTNLKSELLYDIMKGNKIRIKLMDSYNTFNLSGSSKAINGAADICRQNLVSEYFKVEPASSKKFNYEKDFF